VLTVRYVQSWSWVRRKSSLYLVSELYTEMAGKHTIPISWSQIFAGITLQSFFLILPNTKSVHWLRILFRLARSAP
jgi:hypothetical protein